MTETNTLILSGAAIRVFAGDLQPGDFVIYDDCEVRELIPTFGNRVTIKTERRTSLTLRRDFPVLIRPSH